jgi:hypothetical protein
VVQLPAFDADEFDTLRKQMLVGLAISEKTPATIADRRFSTELWGDHPYARPADGTSADLAGLDIDLINGSPLLREWVDDPAATPADLEALTAADEAAWIDERRPFLLY